MLKNISAFSVKVHFYFVRGQILDTYSIIKRIKFANKLLCVVVQVIEAAAPAAYPKVSK